MKILIAKPLFPITAFALATTTALAFMPANRNAVTLYIGYRHVGPLCVATDVVCSDVNNGIICKDASNNALYRLNSSTICPDQLWKPMQ